MSSRDALAQQIATHLATHPEDGLDLLNTTIGAIHSTAHVLPPVIVAPKHEGPEGELVETTILNPRTGVEDRLVAVDISLRFTPAASEADFDTSSRRLTIDYEEIGEHHALTYVTESDSLPVTLPEGWREP